MPSDFALVTGANSGLGTATAEALACKGIHVLLACRRGEDSTATANALANPRISAVPFDCDLGDLKKVRAFVDKLEKKMGANAQVSILVNNAGMNGTGVKPWKTPENVGFLTQTNFLGPFVLTRLMMSKNMLRGGENGTSKARVVNVSSVTHRTHGNIRDVQAFFNPTREGHYPNTKLANALFTLALNEKFGNSVTAVSADPGGAMTGIWRRYGPLARFAISLIFAPADDAATSVVHAAVADMSSAPKYAYVARGAFAWKLLCGEEPSANVPRWRRLTATGIAVFVDWPIRWISGKMLCSHATLVPPTPQARDLDLANAVWDEAERRAGL